MEIKEKKIKPVLLPPDKLLRANLLRRKANQKKTKKETPTPSGRKDS